MFNILEAISVILMIIAFIIFGLFIGMYDDLVKRAINIHKNKKKEPNF